MIQLLKILPDEWKKAKGYIRLDLDYIESALNTRWAFVFGDDNILQPGTIPGDSTADSRYISNQGPGHTLLWDQVNLTNGVKERLPFSSFVQATQVSVLVGRRSTTVGDFEQITLGQGIKMQGTVLSVDPLAIAGSFIPGRDGVDGQDGYTIPGPTGPAGAAGATGPAGATGLMGPPGADGEGSGDNWPVMIPSQITVAQMLALGSWSILTNGDTVAPEVVFDSYGNVISVFVPS